MQYIQTIDRTPTDYEKLTVTTQTVGRLTEVKRIVAKAVFCTIEDASMRYRIDGGEPDSNDGHLLTAGQNLYLADEFSIKNLRFLGSGGTSVAIVTYYK